MQSQYLKSSPEEILKKIDILLEQNDKLNKIVSDQSEKLQQKESDKTLLQEKCDSLESQNKKLNIVIQEKYNQLVDAIAQFESVMKAQELTEQSLHQKIGELNKQNQVLTDNLDQLQSFNKTLKQQNFLLEHQNKVLEIQLQECQVKAFAPFSEQKTPLVAQNAHDLSSPKMQQYSNRERSINVTPKAGSSRF